MSPSTSPLPKGMSNCLKKRQLLNEKVLSPELCRELGKKYLEMGWREDALQFFQKGGIAEELERLKDYCLENGDAYLLGRLGRQSPEDWRRLGEKALALGKLHFARRAFEIAGEEDKTAMVTGLIAGESVAADD